MQDRSLLHFPHAYSVWRVYGQTFDGLCEELGNYAKNTIFLEEF